MKKNIVFILNTMGWLMLFLGLIFASVRDVGLNPQLYYDLQMEAGILSEAGISEADLLQLDAGLARYLGGKQADLDSRIMVFDRVQPAFNAREMQHLADCKRLFSPVVNPWLNLALAVAGIWLALYPRHRMRISGNAYAAGVWCASALILLPIGSLGFWAAVDFSSAFTFFHKILFTNDLWLLNPATDLLIRICPQSMFMNMGLRIALHSGCILLGIPLLISILNRISEKRKRKAT